MLKRTIIIISLLAITAVAILLIWKRAFKESESSVASVRPVAELDASTLLGSFETNEDSANSAYLGKVIVVKGTIDSYTEDSLSVSVYLKKADDFSGVVCVFERTVLSISSIQVGQEVKIKGMCSGYLLDVILNKCSLEQSGSN